MKLLSIVGARPQFIKLGPLSRELKKYHNEICVHTGQHFDEEMSRFFFRDLQLPEPQYNLSVNGGNHGEQTGRMLIQIEKVLLQEKPDLVIVFGDTNSTLAGSLAAAKLGIKCLHIEAGLRSFNRTMPEEINRITSDHVSDFLFAPTATAVKNLNNEGLGEKTFLTGDIMVDSLDFALEIIRNNGIDLQMPPVDKGYYLLTLHRPYNVDDHEKLQLILAKLSQLDNEVLFPVHPRTKNIIKQEKIYISENILLCAPQSYLNFINLQVNASKIITDSGGIQKEAYILRKPCITIRPETEWVETVEEGWNCLVDINDSSVVEKIISFNPQNDQSDVFGSNVAEKMVEEINRALGMERIAENMEPAKS